MLPLVQRCLPRHRRVGRRHLFGGGADAGHRSRRRAPIPIRRSKAWTRGSFRAARSGTAQPRSIDGQHGGRRRRRRAAAWPPRTTTSARSCSNARTCRPTATPWPRPPSCPCSTPRSSSRWFYAGIAGSRRVTPATFVVNIGRLARLRSAPPRARQETPDETTRRHRRRDRLCRGIARRRADQVGPADRLSGEQLPHREHHAVRGRRRQGHGRQAQDPGASERVAVQGARNQARRAGRTGAGRRDPARQLRERGPAVRHRRHSVPRHVVRAIR